MTAPAVVDVEAMCVDLQVLAAEADERGHSITATQIRRAMKQLRQQAEQIEQWKDKAASSSEDAEHNYDKCRQQAEDYNELVAEKAEIAKAYLEQAEQIAELRSKLQVQYGELIAGDDRRDAERYRRLRIGDRYDFYDHDRNSRMKLLKEGAELDAAIDAAIGRDRNGG